MEKAVQERIEQRTLTHPCYTCGGCGASGKNARIHLPVAPKCNIQCNYCVRKYDCMNESRPGVTSEILSPEQAAEKYAIVKEKVDNLTVVGIAGPGDALANWPEVRETLKRIRDMDNDVTFCLSTNGLMLPLYAQEMLDAGVTHVTITINSVDPQIGAQIYEHVDYLGQRYTGVSAAAILMSNQLSGLKYLADRGAVVKVNCVVVKGINDHHLEEVVKKVRELGAYMTNLMQMIPVEESAFSHLGQVSMKEIQAMRRKCEPYIKQMYHCRQCRADAIGTIDHDRSIEFREQKEDKTVKAIKRFAVATDSGVVVDCHFGRAKQFYVYEMDGEVARLLETRNVDQYCSGSEDCDDAEDRLSGIYEAVSDCDAVLTMRIGEVPRRRLTEKGLRVITTYDVVESAIKKAVSDQ